LYCAPVESGLSPLSTGALNGCSQRVAIPDAVTIQFDEVILLNITPPSCTMGHAVTQFVEALRCKPEGRGFDSR
jgi:hypothetical protein